MPCRVEDDGASEARLREEANKVTQMLCALCTQLESTTDFDNAFEHIPGLVKWWTNHKIVDSRHRAEERERQRLELVKQQAKAKLTPEERKLLGIR